MYDAITRERIQERLQGIIDYGERNLQTGLAAIEREWNDRQDMIVKPGALRAHVDEAGTITPQINGREYALTDHSRAQLLARADIPTTYMQRMIDAGAHRLAQANLSQMLRRRASRGVLVREVNGRIKGIMSPSYKRVDTSPLFANFYREASQAGMVPMRTVLTDTKAGITMIGRNIQEIAPGEFVIFGMQVTNSDYGAGAVTVGLLVLRVICTNLMTGIDLFRRVHLGRRFQAGSDFIELSQQTADLDAATIASATQDAIRSGQKTLNTMRQHLIDNVATPVNLETALNQLRRAGLTNADAENVGRLYDDKEAPVEMLPRVEGRWRLSNVVTHLARSQTDDRRLEFERAGFKIMFPAALAA